MPGSVRSARVLLRAEISGYKRDMAEAATATDRLAGSGGRASGSLSKLFKIAGGTSVAFGIAKLVKDSVTLEASYSKTMAQVAVATGAPKAQLKDLDDLALQLGRDTVFSAQDAADAMLALAKGGLTTAQIKAGVLANTLTLASAGGLELGDAANTVVNAMGAFGLKATQTGAAVAALAGAANASSADVSDITQALAQAGTSAHAAGLSIQETTAFLAEFANSGIKGSDAGTSLRTMLTRLVPQTKQASDAMKSLNLSYVDGNGKLVSASQIAARTQKAFKGLSDEERIRKTNLIFGNDAQRAVNVITEQGAAGLAKYVKQTSDLTQAQKLAKAANSGTAGSLEQLKGTIETAEIQIGKGLAPTVRNLADGLNELVQNGDFETWAANGGHAAEDFFQQVGPLVHSLGDLSVNALPAVKSAAEATVAVLELAAHIITPLVDGFNKLPASAQQALILAAGAQTLSHRLGGLPGITSRASGGLLVFGGNAKKAGKDAEETASKVQTLGGSLKAFGVLAAASYAIPKSIDLFNQIKGEIGNHAPDVDDLAASMGRLGQASEQTGKLIQSSIDSTDIGRFADKFGIDIDRLKAGLEESGTQTGYFADHLKSLRQDFIDAARDGHIDFDLGNTIDALSDLGTAFDAAHKKSIRVADDMNDLAVDMAYPDASARGLAARLKALPDEVETKVLTPGAIKSTEDVVKLARQYKLTPSQVKTVMEAQDFASADVKKVLALLAKTDKKHKAKVDADTTAAEARMTALLKLLNQFRSKTIHINTVTNSIRTDNGRVGTVQANGSVLDFYSAGGLRENHVAQIAPAGSWRVFGEPETGGESYIPLAPSKRARSIDIWAETGRRLGVQGFAAGGTRGGLPDSNSEWARNASKADLKWAVGAWQKALDKNTDKLGSLKASMENLSTTVRDGFRTDGFNQGDPNTGVSGLAALGNTLVLDTAHANEFDADLAKLKKKGISDGLYNALAASTDLQTAGELSQKSRSGIDYYDKLFLDRQRATAKLGTDVGTAAYGKQVAALTALGKSLHNDLKDFDKRLEAGSYRGTKAGIEGRASSAQRTAKNRSS